MKFPKRKQSLASNSPQWEFLLKLMITIDAKCTQTSANGSIASQTGRKGGGFEKARGNQGNWVT